MRGFGSVTDVRRSAIRRSHGAEVVVRLATRDRSEDPTPRDARPLRSRLSAPFASVAATDADRVGAGGGVEALAAEGHAGSRRFARDLACGYERTKRAACVRVVVERVQERVADPEAVTGRESLKMKYQTS